MSDNTVDNSTTIAAPQEVEVANTLAINTITNEYPNTITVKSNEFAIVGDALFATTKEEVPGWMRGLVGELAKGATANAYNAMAGFNYNLYNAMIALQVAENKYQQTINTRITDQEAFVQAVETLNSTAQNAQAEIVGIKQTYATKDFATATAAQTLEASLNGGAIKSSLGQLASTMTNQYGTMAQRMDVLESTFEDLELGVEGYANATNTLETYVGLTEGVPDGTGLIAKVGILEQQVDGKIEYLYYDSYADVAGAVDEVSALSTIKTNWGAAENGNVVYFRNTTNGYWYSSTADSFQTIDDTSIYEALQRADKAQATADGVVVSYYAIEQSTAPDTSKLWLNDAKLLQKFTTTWKAVPVKKGDTLTTFVTTTSDSKVYMHNGTNWVTETTAGVVAGSKSVTDLKLGLDGLDDSIYGTSGLKQTLEGAIDSEGARVESKFAYNSSITLNNQTYNSGFGLATSLHDSNIPIGNSEFWINADKFKMTTTGYTGPKYSPFTVDGTNGSITFNGKVTFGNNQTGTIDEAIAASIQSVVVGDKNINITDNLIPTTSLITDVNNAGYQFVGDPVKGLVAGIDTFAEVQIILDGDIGAIDEVYSPYIDEVTMPYYYRFGIKGVTSLTDKFYITLISNTDVVSYHNVTVTLEPGMSMDANNWYIVDGIINPTGSGAGVSGRILTPALEKVATISNFNMVAGTAKVLLGWVGSCTISRMKLAKITADTFTGSVATVDYVESKGYVAGEDVYTPGTTTIDGNKITTGSISLRNGDASNYILLSSSSNDLRIYKYGILTQLFGNTSELTGLFWGVSTTSAYISSLDSYLESTGLVVRSYNNGIDVASRNRYANEVKDTSGIRIQTDAVSSKTSTGLTVITKVGHDSAYEPYPSNTSTSQSGHALAGFFSSTGRGSPSTGIQIASNSGFASSPAGSYYNSNQGSTGLYVASSTGYAGAGKSCSGIGVNVYNYNYADAGTTYGLKVTNSTYNNSSCYGVWSSSTQGFDFYAAGTAANYGPFTGSHEGVINDEFTGVPGDILKDLQVFYVHSLSNTTFNVTVAEEYDRPIGVLVGVHEGTPNGINTENMPLGLRTAVFNALGEGMINVTSEGGNFKNGDLIECSSIAGKGRKQKDDIIRNTTVAKIRGDYVFTEKEVFACVPCIYLCG